MTKTELEALALSAGEVLRDLIIEEHERILLDFGAGEKEAALHDAKFKFGLRFAIKVTDEKTVHSLAWSQGHKRTFEADRKDPNQPDLPGTEEIEAEAPPAPKKRARRKKEEEGL